MEAPKPKTSFRAHKKKRLNRSLSSFSFFLATVDVVLLFFFIPPGVNVFFRLSVVKPRKTEKKMWKDCVLRKLGDGRNANKISGLWLRFATLRGWLIWKTFSSQMFAFIANKHLFTCMPHRTVEWYRERDEYWIRLLPFMSNKLIFSDFSLSRARQ